MENIKEKITEQEYLNACDIIDKYSNQLKTHYFQAKIKNRSIKTVKELDESDLCDISIRLYNILKFKFTDIRLCDITKEEFFKARNAGVGTYNDLCNFIQVINLK